MKWEVMSGYSSFTEAFDLFSEIADHKDELLESCLLQAVDDKTKNGFSATGISGLG